MCNYIFGVSLHDFLSFEYLSTCLITSFLICKRPSTPERHRKQVSHHKEDHLLAKIFKLWRLNAQRMMGESISWHICSGLMVYPSRRFMCAGVEVLVSHTFSSYTISYLFALSVPLVHMFLCYLLAGGSCILCCSAVPEKLNIFYVHIICLIPYHYPSKSKSCLHAQLHINLLDTLSLFC
jgi:hypothetical protein